MTLAPPAVPLAPRSLPARPAPPPRSGSARPAWPPAVAAPAVPPRSKTPAPPAMAEPPAPPAIPVCPPPNGPAPAAALSLAPALPGVQSCGHVTTSSGSHCPSPQSPPGEALPPMLADSAPPDPVLAPPLPRSAGVPPTPCSAPPVASPPLMADPSSSSSAVMGSSGCGFSAHDHAHPTSSTRNQRRRRVTSVTLAARAHTSVASSKLRTAPLGVPETGAARATLHPLIPGMPLLGVGESAERRDLGQRPREAQPLPVQPSPKRSHQVGHGAHATSGVFGCVNGANDGGAHHHTVDLLIRHQSSLCR